MPIEYTDLERRVLAHEQILQALIARDIAGLGGRAELIFEAPQ